MRRTFWLASYPKSGNTWFRMLIANIGRDAPVDINDLPHRGGIASARGWFDNMMLFPSGLLTHEESDRLRPRIYEAINKGRTGGEDFRDDDDAAKETRVGDAFFIKTHDAYTHTSAGEPLMGGAAAAAGAIVIVRDPRDVAPSLANHGGQTIDEAIAFMAKSDAAFSGARDRQPNQLRQQLPGWAGYQATWLDQRDIPVHLIRYEDLQADTAGTLIAALAFAGIDLGRAEAMQAARLADFRELRRQEEERGFREAPRARPKGNFFRRGIAGAWHDELTPAQVAAIEADQAGMMARLGYERSAQHERMAG